MEQDSRAYAFGPYRFDAEDRLLTRDGVPVRVTPKAADLLLALVESAGHVVSKQDLIRKVWPDSFVEDGSLTFQVNQLRQALGESKDGPRYIETVPRRGYKFVPPVITVSADAVPVEEVAPSNSVTPEVTPAETPVDRLLSESRAPRVYQGPLLRRIAGSVVAVAAGVAFVGSMLLSNSKPLRVVETTQLTHDEQLKHLGSPILSDGERLIVRGSSIQRAITAANGEAAPSEILKNFYVYDASPVRSEYLGIRPADRGAERALWAVPFGGESPRRLGQIAAEGAAWSRDGGRFAYSHENSLYVADASGTAIQKLWSFTGQPSFIRWSPDGLRLRFTVYTRSNRTVTQRLWEIRSDGTELRPLLEDLDEPSQSCCGDWMPDGANYVFHVPQQYKEDLWLLHERERFFRRPIKEIVQLTSGPIRFTSPLASPDGERIFALGTTNATTLERYDRSTQAFRPYAGDLSAWGVDFSRDGKELVYLRHPDNTVWRASADGTGRRQLTFAPLEADGCAWSPDGTQIALRARLPGTRTKVYVMPASGGTPVPLTAADVEQGMPSWSPDGTRLAFGDVPETFAQPTGTEAIHIYDLRRRELTSIPGSQHLWTSRWSPDGRYLAALTLTRLQELVLFDFSTNQWKKLNVSHVNSPTWSGDSKYLYFDVEGGANAGFKRLLVAEGFVEPLADLREHHYIWAGPSPDGSLLILRRSPTEIYALKLQPH